jgi:hypothetical protein
MRPRAERTFALTATSASRSDLKSSKQVKTTSSLQTLSRPLVDSRASFALILRGYNVCLHPMYITELIAALQVIKAQYGDIEVVVPNQQSWRIQLTVVDDLDPKTAQPTGKIVQAQ